MGRHRAQGRAHGGAPRTALIPTVGDAPVPGRHRGGRRTGPSRRGSAALAGSGLAVAAITTLIVSQTVSSPGAAAGGPRRHTLPTGTPTTGTPSTGTAGAGPASSGSAAAAAAADSASPVARSALTELVDTRSSSSTSVAALDTTTGATVQVGATSGMTTASAVKLELLESLLLQRQRSGTALSDSDLDSATAMIEHSDNDAAERVFWAIGGRAAVVGLEHDLGLSTTRTVPGDSDYWGLTTTSAGEQLVLLRNLVDEDSPLRPTARARALHLMRNVQADQTWGVPVVASKNTSPAVKNGWLAIDGDDDRWAVNSLGVVTIAGHTVLVAVMTQHDSSFDAGVTRVESLARAAAAAVRG